MAARRRAAYQAIKPDLLPYVLDSFARLRGEADIVLVEGAGSASEVNLRANDIANMGFARAAGVPVVLIGDIDRGGVIASLVGTKAVIDAGGRGADLRVSSSTNFAAIRLLFADGMARIARTTGWAPLGLVPYFAARGCCRPRMRWRSNRAAADAKHGARASDRRSAAAAYRQFRRSRSARRRA